MTAAPWMYVPAVLAIAAAGINLTRRVWIVNAAALALQYLGVFVLLCTVRPVSLAVVKLLVGWMVTLTLFLSLITDGKIRSAKAFFSFSAGEIFRSLAGVVAMFFLAVFLPELQSIVFPQTSLPLLLAAFGLLVLGLFQASLIEEPFYVIIGLLTFLSGVELLYASLELSFLLEALFAGVNLGLALVGAFFVIKDAEIPEG
ncbi:MAG: hypothetical protein AAGU04_02735 [Anaerolineaceae bacterium]